MRQCLGIFLCFKYMKQNETNLMPKNAEKFICKNCNFSCSKKSNWDKHLMTRKHINETNETKNETNETEKMPLQYVCNICKSIFNSRTTLWRHNKKCQKMPKNAVCSDIGSSVFDKELLVKMILQNQDVMNKMIELMPQVGYTNSHNTVNNTLTNSNNTNHFNIQMFLNEHCKNAMNLTDFIESLPITAETYDNTLENGLTKSMTHLITNGLSQLDVLERPIHCTDTARKTLYVKENNAWEKDNELLTLMKGVKKIIFKQRTMLKKWQNANEGWDTDELLQEKMTKLVFHSMKDVGNDEREMSKIIRAISKNVYLDNDTKSKYL